MAEEFDFVAWLDKIIAKDRERRVAREHKRQHSYVADLIRVLLPRENGLRRHMVLHILERQRHRDGLAIPAKFEEAVQSSYNHYSVDSSVFKKRNAPLEEGLFFSPEGKGSGRWAVNRERAEAWIKARRKEITE